ATLIDTLSLHDTLPIWPLRATGRPSTRTLSAPSTRTSTMRRSGDGSGTVTYPLSGADHVAPGHLVENGLAIDGQPTDRVDAQRPAEHAVPAEQRHHRRVVEPFEVDVLGRVGPSDEAHLRVELI